MALLSSDCRGTVESLSSVHSSSTIAELPFSLLVANCTYRVGKVQSIFISGQLKVIRYSAIPLFRIPRFTASGRSPVCQRLGDQ